MTSMVHDPLIAEPLPASVLPRLNFRSCPSNASISTDFYGFDFSCRPCPARNQHIRLTQLASRTRADNDGLRLNFPDGFGGVATGDSVAIE
jgi:hypothetical protein